MIYVISINKEDPNDYMIVKAVDYNHYIEYVYSPNRCSNSLQGPTLLNWTNGSMVGAIDWTDHVYGSMEELAAEHFEKLL